MTCGDTKTPFLMVCLLVFVGTALAGQSATPALPLPEFAAATVKPVDMNGEILVSFTIRPGGRLEIGAWDLYGLIRTAFHPERITGGADWTRLDRFNIQAVPPEEMRAGITDLRRDPFIADPRLRQMLQALLIRRFGLRFHYETVTSEVYLLQKGAQSPAFHPTTVEPSKFSSSRWQSITRDHGQWVLQGATTAALAQSLSGALQVPVRDETGLTGAYDYKQRGTAEAPSVGGDLSSSLLSFFTSELKLKLRKAKRPVNIL